MSHDTLTLTTAGLPSGGTVSLIDTSPGGVVPRCHLLYDGGTYRPDMDPAAAVEVGEALISWAIRHGHWPTPAAQWDRWQLPDPDVFAVLVERALVGEDPTVENYERYASAYRDACRIAAALPEVLGLLEQYQAAWVVDAEVEESEPPVWVADRPHPHQCDVVFGHADGRPCTLCGLGDRAPIHHGWPGDPAAALVDVATPQVFPKVADLRRVLDLVKHEATMRAPGHEDRVAYDRLREAVDALGSVASDAVTLDMHQEVAHRLTETLRVRMPAEVVTTRMVRCDVLGDGDVQVGQSISLVQVSEDEADLVLLLGRAVPADAPEDPRGLVKVNERALGHVLDAFDRWAREHTTVHTRADAAHLRDRLYHPTAPIGFVDPLDRDGDPVEDEDGAPLPESVQTLIRSAHRVAAAVRDESVSVLLTAIDGLAVSVQRVVMESRR